jgi:hypothetical protein
MNLRLPVLSRRTVQIALLFAFTFLGATLRAQDGQFGYDLTASSGTFTSIVGTTGSTQLSVLQTDDAISGAVNIGFPFYYQGVQRTQLKVTSNGLLVFNLTTTDSFYTNNMTSNSGHAIAPLWDDLSGSGGQSTYVTSGTAPNRVFTVEYLNWKWNYNSSAAGISFQVRLYESTNDIEFIYRQEAGTLSSPSANIGLVGGTGIFYSLANASSNPHLDVTGTNMINVKPATGQVYLFTPKTTGGNTGGNTAPTQQAANIIVTGSTTRTITWTNGNGEYRAVFMKKNDPSWNITLSNNKNYQASSTFGLGEKVSGTGWVCVYNGTGDNVQVTGLSEGDEYKIFVVEYSGQSGHQKYNTQMNSANKNPIHCNVMVPSLQATNVVASMNLNNSMTINWSKGNGNGRLVFVKETNVPESLTLVDQTWYNGSSTFGNGSSVNGWYCVVHVGQILETSVTVNGISLDKAYSIQVFEYNRSLNSNYIVYNSTVAANNPVQINHQIPAIQVSGVKAAMITDNSMSLSWTNGNGNNRVVFMKVLTNFNDDLSLTNNTTYTASSELGSGASVQNWFCVYNGNAATATVNGILPGKNYHIKVFEYRGGLGNEMYNNSRVGGSNFISANQYTTPTVQASNIKATTISGTTPSMNVKWKPGSNGSIVFIKQANTFEVAPVTDYTDYTVSSFGTGTSINGWYCVFAGLGDQATISGLSSNDNYLVQVFSYNGGSGFKKYNTSIVPDQNSITVSLKNIVGYELSYSGTSYTTIQNLPGITNLSSIQEDDAISGVIDIGFPFNFFGQEYTQLKATSNGAVTFDLSATSSFNDNSLSIQTTPLIAILWDDLNGDAGRAYYRTTGTEPNRIFTLECVGWKWGKAATSAGVSFQLNLYETDNSITIFRQGESGPLNNPSASIGLVKGFKQFYSMPDSWYRSVIDDNINYITPIGNKFQPVLTKAITPSVQAKLSMASSWKNNGSTWEYIQGFNDSGNGAYQAIFVKEANYAAPPSLVDGTYYKASSTYGSGDAVDGWYCVFNRNNIAAGAPLKVQGLESSKTYQVFVSSYNGQAGDQKYNTTAFHEVNPRGVASGVTFCVSPPKPIITVSIGSTATTLTSSSNTGNQWLKNGLPIAGATDSLFTTSEPGVYTVIVTNGPCPSAFSNPVTIKQSQSITFPNPGDKNADDPSFPLGATSTSGLPITYSTTTPDQVFISGNYALLNGVVGTAKIKAQQSGNAQYNAAPPVEITFFIKAVPVITWFNSNWLQTNTVSGNQWYKDGVAIPGATSQYLAASPGSYTVQVTSGGYVSDFSAPLVVTANNQTITFSELPYLAIGASMDLNAFAQTDSGLPVTYACNPSVAIINGSIVTGVAEGNVQIMASQPGNEEYNPANNVFQFLTVSNRIPQTITFDLQEEAFVNDGPIILTAQADSGLPVSYESMDEFVATISDGNILNLVGPGFTEITATQAGDAVYNTAQPQTRFLFVFPGSNAQEESAVAAYPNEVEEELTVDVSLFSKEETTVTMYDLMGRKIDSKTGRGIFHFDMKDYKSGNYVLKATNGKRVVSKHIKKK